MPNIKRPPYVFYQWGKVENFANIFKPDGARKKFITRLTAVNPRSWEKGETIGNSLRHFFIIIKFRWSTNEK
jgi:hypothetical protein